MKFLYPLMQKFTFDNILDKIGVLLLIIFLGIYLITLVMAVNNILEPLFGITLFK